MERMALVGRVGGGNKRESSGDVDNEDDDKSGGDDDDDDDDDDENSGGGDDGCVLSSFPPVRAPYPPAGLHLIVVDSARRACFEGFALVCAYALDPRSGQNGSCLRR